MHAVIELMAPALLAALVVTQALDGERLRVGADTAGVAAAGGVVLRGGGVIPAVAIAVDVTAGSRALG